MYQIIVPMHTPLGLFSSQAHRINDLPQLQTAEEYFSSQGLHVSKYFFGMHIDPHQSAFMIII